MQAALSSHPDKVAESDRAAADIKFKAISQAYEILQDDQKRELYDTHGMAAFEKGPGFDPDNDPIDILSQMFGGMGGMPGMPGMGRARGPRKPAKGADVEQPYEVTLEELYKGKTTKFANKKKVICSHCKGKGGKESAKSKPCETCKGQGWPSRSIIPRRSDLTSTHRNQASPQISWSRTRYSGCSQLRYMSWYRIYLQGQRQVQEMQRFEDYRGEEECGALHT